MNSAASLVCVRMPIFLAMRRLRVSSVLKGIGLCRTEHMFFAEDRTIPLVQAMILARDEKGRRKARNSYPLQRKDFVGFVQGDGRVSRS